MSLTDVVPWDRRLEQYELMFDLSPSALEALIPGCGDEPARFNAEMTELGHVLISVDPIDQLSTEQIKQRVSHPGKSVLRL